MIYIKDNKAISLFNGNNSINKLMYHNRVLYQRKTK